MVRGMRQQRAPTYALQDLYRDFLRFRFCPFPFPRTDFLENKKTETDRERAKGKGRARRQWGQVFSVLFSSSSSSLSPPCGGKPIPWQGFGWKQSLCRGFGTPGPPWRLLVLKGGQS